MGWIVAIGLSLFVSPGRPANAQNDCTECREQSCNGLKGKDFAKCVAECLQRCRPAPPKPKPSFDPRCSDRTATGVIQCVITMPPVNQHETPYPAVVFAPGDVVDAYADGCVQTGGHGDTWKRYVNPFGNGTDNPRTEASGPPSVIWTNFQRDTPRTKPTNRASHWRWMRGTPLSFGTRRSNRRAAFSESERDRHMHEPRRVRSSQTRRCSAQAGWLDTLSW